LFFQNNSIICHIPGENQQDNWEYFIHLLSEIFSGIYGVFLSPPTLRGQPTALCHSRWQPAKALTKSAMVWGRGRIYKAEDTYHVDMSADRHKQTDPVKVTGFL
jgi:hypothetical protein